MVSSYWKRQTNRDCNDFKTYFATVGKNSYFPITFISERGAAR